MIPLGAALPLRPAGRAVGGDRHGVLQAVNTYEHHEATVRGASRPERNMGLLHELVTV